MRKGNNTTDKTSNEWKWSDGSSWDYHNFNSSEPSTLTENNLEMYADGTWNDISENGHPRYAIYQYKK